MVHKEYSDSAASILFVFIGLLIGIAVYQIRKRVSFPISSILVILGVGVFAIGKYLGAHLETTLNVVGEIESEMIMLTFMPGLIFETAFG
mmetsp:Transcript_6847/g.866  ORF Transcript_6847/g.866 Transcript_6847/m.866 type:complete len:90 (+) Transcript_6847:1385-1654(+)